MGRFFEVLMINATIAELQLPNLTVSQAKDLFLDNLEEFPQELASLILQRFSIPDGLINCELVCKLFARQILKVQNVTHYYH